MRNETSERKVALRGFTSIAGLASALVSFVFLDSKNLVHLSAFLTVFKKLPGLLLVVATDL